MAKSTLIYGSISSYMASQFINEIDELGDEPLNVRINTEGGEPEYAFGMIAKFAEHKGEKSVSVDGKAMSMGLFYCCYTDKVECLDVSQFLLHRAAYPAWFEESAYFTDALKSNVEAVNASLKKAFENKVDVAKFEELKGVKLKDVFSMDSRIDVFLTAQEAKKIGLVSKINQITPSKKAEIDSLMGVKMAASAIELPIIKNQNRVMTIETLKSENPALYAQIIGMGVAQEKDRVGAWMAFNDIDPVAVAAGVASGTDLTKTAMADFSKKMFAKEQVVAIEGEAAPVIEAAAPKVELSAAEKAKAEFSSQVEKHLNLKKD